MKTLEVRFTGSPESPVRPVGTLLEQGGRVYFEYAEAWLRTGWNLSPFRLPFTPGVFEHRDRGFGSLPGLFDDSLPDGWGLQLMDRHFRKLGRDRSSLGPLDLAALARQSEDLLTGRSSEVLPQLLRAGGSPGGARPKVLVGFNPDGDLLLSGADDLPAGFEHWLVKFSAGEDDAGAGAAEYAYSLMARAAGLELPATRLFETRAGGRYFGVKRFDRQQNRRRHVHSFGNLIQTPFRIPSCDYLDLLQATAVLTRDHREVLKALRQMAFNVLAHNRDDHAKNFAFLLDATTGGWALTPAFDLCFSPGPGGEHTMTLAGEGRAPGAPHILQVGLARNASRGEVAAILDEVRAAVADWPEWARQAGVLPARAREIGLALGVG